MAQFRTAQGADKTPAPEALAADGVERARLGYEVLVKLTIDELLEREDLSMDMRVSHDHPGTVAMDPSIVRTHDA